MLHHISQPGQLLNVDRRYTINDGAAPENKLFSVPRGVSYCATGGEELRAWLWGLWGIRSEHAQILLSHGGHTAAGYLHIQKAPPPNLPLLSE